MKWIDVIAKPQWAELDPEQQAYARQRWVDQFAVPQAREAGFTDAEIIPLREKAISEYDNGQGMVSSFFASAGRGVAGIASGAVGGIGALTNDPALLDTANEMDAAVANALPVNPSLTKTNFAGNAIGQAAGVLATAGAGGALAKGLAGVRAIAVGSEAAAMTSGVLSGARGGAQDAEQYGMSGGAYAARVVFGGLTEYVTEKLPFGMATETGLAQKLLGGAVKPSRGLTFAGGVVSEAVEGGSSQLANNAANMALAPDGVETPTLFTGVAGSTAGGAIGGSFFGAVNAATGANREAPFDGLPPPAGFPQSQPSTNLSQIISPPAAAPPPIPIGKASLNGLPFVFDGTGWQRPATEQELGAEPGMLLRPLDPNDAAEGSVIAALNAKAKAAIRRRAEEKTLDQKDSKTDASSTNAPEPVEVQPIQSGLNATPERTNSPEVDDGVPPLPGLLPPPGMRWDMEGNAVPLETAGNNETAPQVTNPPLVDGQAQPLSAPVLTPTGPVPIGSLKPGDSTLAPEGTTQRVTGTFPQGRKRVFEIALTDGSKALASDDHLWLARLGNYSAEAVTTARIKAGLARGEAWSIPVMGEN